MFVSKYVNKIEKKKIKNTFFRVCSNLNEITKNVLDDNMDSKANTKTLIYLLYFTKIAKILLKILCR